MSNGPRIFTYQEALSTFASVRDRTSIAVKNIEALVHGVQSRDEMERRRRELETAYQSIVEGWAEDMKSMGCEVKGLWLVDWDSGDGYYCWRYPEESLAHFHTYEEGFAGRLPIA